MMDLSKLCDAYMAVRNWYTSQLPVARWIIGMLLAFLVAVAALKVFA
jgi:hypothetical protein